MSKKWLYVTFEIKGLNADRLINTLKKRGVILYNIKKATNKSTFISVKFADSKKVFAISQKLCYNIRKVGTSGLLYPFYYLLTNVGLLIGLVLFVAISIISNNVIFDISLTGSGGVYKKQVYDILNEKGVKPFTLFSSVDLKQLSKDILVENDRLSFVSCEKVGNTLKIDLAIAQDKTQTISGKATTLMTDVDGEVESIKVYRGTAVKNVGDKVYSGEEIVSKWVTIKEQTIEVGVLAVVTLKCQFDYQYVSEKENDEEFAVMIAENVLDKEIISKSVTKKRLNGKYLYNVNLLYRKVLFAG